MRKILLVLLLIFLTANITSASQVLTYEVSLDSDDMEEYVADGKMDHGSSDLELCLEKPGTSNEKPQIIDLRFKDVTIPNGVKITDAYLQFTADENKNKDPFEVTIKGIAEYDTQTFTQT